MRDACVSHDWDEVLRWGSRIDELVRGQDRGTILSVLMAFALAYQCKEECDKAGPIWVQCAEACGASEAFSMQVQTLGWAGECFMAIGDFTKAALWFERGREISVEQGFVSRESEMCGMMGQACSKSWRFREAVEQYRRALTAAQHVKDDASSDRASLELSSRRGLVEALFKHGRPEDLEEADSMFIRLSEEGDNTADFWLWSHYLRGLLHVIKRNFQAAAEAFRAAVDVARTNPGKLKGQHASHAFCAAQANLKACDSGEGDAPSLSAILIMLDTAQDAEDWPGVLRWESQMEELLLTVNKSSWPWLISDFATAHFNLGHFAKAAVLFQRRLKVVGKMEWCISLQGADMCEVGECFRRLEDTDLAETWYQKARKFGEAYGCMGTECAPRPQTLNPEP